MKRPVLRGLGFLFGWYAILSLPLLLGPVPAFTVQVAGAVAFWWRYLDGGERGVPIRRLARYRIRPLGEWQPWVLRMLLLLVVFDLALGVTYHTFIPIPERPPGPLETYTQQHPLGWLPVVFLIFVAAPFVEEFSFRGIMQRAWERSAGPGNAIVATALLFAIIHFDAWRLGYFFIAGAVLGMAVWITRSIWAGVILHASHNVVAVLVEVLFPGRMGFERAVVAAAGRWTAPVVLLASGFVLYRWLRDGARARQRRAPGPAPVRA